MALNILDALNSTQTTPTSVSDQVNLATGHNSNSQSGIPNNTSAQNLNSESTSIPSASLPTRPPEKPNTESQAPRNNPSPSSTQVPSPDSSKSLAGSATPKTSFTPVSSLASTNGGASQPATSSGSGSSGYSPGVSGGSSFESRPGSYPPSQEPQSGFRWRWLAFAVVLLLLTGGGVLAVRNYVNSRLTDLEADNASAQASLMSELNNLESNKANRSGDTFTGDVNIETNLEVKNTTTTKHLVVTDSANLPDLNVDGHANVTESLVVAGDSSTGGNQTIAGNLTVQGQSFLNGNVLLQSNLTVQGDTLVADFSATQSSVSGNSSVDGNFTVAGNTDLQGSIFNSSSNNNGRVYIDDDLQVTGTIYGNVSGSINPGFTQGSVIFQGISGLSQNNANFFWDITNNRLGIGTNSPLYALDVSGGSIAARFGGRVIGTEAVNADEFVTLGQLTSVSAGNFFLQNGNSFGELAILGTNDAFGLAFETGGMERMRIDSSGNVGIGTSAPTATLEVTSNTAEPTILISGTNRPSLDIIRGANAGVTFTMDSNGNLRVAHANNLNERYMSFYAGSRNVDFSGNVGIGWAAPTNRLEIKSTGDGDGIVLRESYAGSSMLFNVLQNTGDGTGATLNLGNGSGVTTTSINSGAGNSYFNGGGNVGIGTTGPTSKLTIDMAGTNGGIRLQNAVQTRIDFETTQIGSANWNIVNEGNANRFSIRQTGGNNMFWIEAGAPANSLIINPSGNIGIGTATPTSFKLEVAGNIGPSADLTYDLGSATRRWNNIYANGFVGAITPTGFTQGSVVFAGSGGTLTQDNANFFWDDTNNRLGIGTAIPANPLDIRIDSGDKFVARIRNSATSVGQGHGLLVDTTRGTGTGDIPVLHVTANNGSSSLFYVRNDGNVGIGTTGPEAKLDVQGNIQILNNGGAVAGDIQSQLGFRRTAGAADRARIAAIWEGADRDQVALGFYTANDAPGTSDPTERLRITATGNVGIGTTSPDTLAHIYTPDSSGITPLLKLQKNTSSTDGRGVSIDFVNSTVSSVVGARIASHRDEVAGSSDLRLYTGANTSDARLVIDNGGNVGIGTTAPGVRFQVNPDSSFTNGYNIASFANAAGTALLTVRNFSTGSGDYQNGYGLTTGTRMILESTVSGVSFRANGQNGINLTGVSATNTKLETVGSGSLLTLQSDSVGQNVSTGLGTNLGIGLGTTVPTSTLQVVQAIKTSGSPTLATFTGGAHTTLAASTEASDVNFNLARTVQFATGALATQRAFQISAPTYEFVGASTITDASTLAISGAPIGGTNATITTASALRIAAGALTNTTNGYGLYVSAPTGATNNYAATFATGNVGIGTTAPSEKLDVNGNINIPTTTATTGIIKSGTNRFIHNYGTENFFAGVQAGNLTMTGGYNVAIGVNSMPANTSGRFNATVGRYSLFVNTTGEQNAAVGSGALIANLSGNFNAAVGTNVLFGNTTGSNNVALGYQAGYSATSANANTTGSNNVFIGYNTGPASTTQLDNATAIGAFSVVGASNSIVLGCIAGTNGCTTTPNVGIGTTAPAYKLHVAGETLINNDSSNTAGNPFLILRNMDLTVNNYAQINFATLDSSSELDNAARIGTQFTGRSATGVSGALVFHTSDNAENPTERLRIDSVGNVGIGQTVPTSILHTVASGAKTAAYSGNLLTNTATSSTASINKYGLEIQSTGTWNGTSANNVGLYVSSVTGGTNNYDAIFNGGGNVGIGTTSPSAKLDVQSIAASVFNTTVTKTGSAGPVFGIRRARPAGAAILANDVVGDLNFQGSYDGGTNFITGARILAEATGTFSVSSAPTRLSFYTNPVSSITAAERMRIDENGNVGIGTTSPGSKLDIYNNTATSNTDLFRLLSDVGGVSNVKFRVDSDGDVFTDGSTTIGTPADIAENYTNSDGASAGDVVVFTSPTSVAKSSSTNQKNLAGVVSSAPGIILSGNTPGVPVALSGRVPTKVSTANGSIEPGDYLTSGPNGRAVKATAAGPIIGTALEPATTDSTIEVFVHLGSFTPTGTQVVQGQDLTQPSNTEQSDTNLQATGDTNSTDPQTQTGTTGSFETLNVSGSTQLAELTVNGETTLSTLTVTGETTLEGSLNVAGPATLSGNLTVTGTTTVAKLVVQGHVVVGEDTSGTVIIPAGTTEITVTFADSYANVPNITATADDFIMVRIKDKTVNGFKIQLKSSHPTDVTIDWIALEPAQ